ncbi:hypothetical protein LUZ60_011791 [Juncus effusus]|nr:hypothetical protein LUZ60_011791 [Juncus effusus]
MDSSSSSTSDSEQYSTIWSAPPKKPSGRTKFRETRHPVYKGVRRRGASDRWICEVRNPNDKNRLWLGTFPTAEMAARAHDAAMMALRGKSACLNFADSACLVKIPDSFSSMNEIKKAAVEAARSFSNGETEDASSPVYVATSSADVAREEKESCTMLGLEGDLDMDLRSSSYYASLAEGLLMEPPSWERYGDLEDEGWGDEEILSLISSFVVTELDDHELTNNGCDMFVRKVQSKLRKY